MNNTNETKLLEKVCSLDPAAITDVYDRYSPGIYRYAMRLTGSAEQAEDCLAETFSRFLIALHDGRGPRKFLQAYLYRIAHNWITDLYRRNLPLVELDEQQLAIDETGNQPVLSFDLKSQQQRVRWALAQLKAEQRQAIVLRYLEEWEIDEIAHSLKKPAGAVRALLHRAVVKLRELLHGEKVENENEYKRKIFI